MHTKSFQKDTWGANELIGAIIMVGLAAIASGYLIHEMNNFPIPSQQDDSHLSYEVLPGDSGWGSGDEYIVLTHEGGRDIMRDGTQVIIRQNGVETTYDKNQLTGGFSDGKLRIGETATFTLQVNTTDSLEIRTILKDVPRIHSEAKLKPYGGYGQIAGSCPDDNNPPAIVYYQHDPTNITSETPETQATNIFLILNDDCAGNDINQIIKTHWRINDGTNPPYQTINLTYQGANRWTGLIPAQEWTIHAGKTFEYYAANYYDTMGNTGNSTVQQDYIDIGGTSIDSIAEIDDPGFAYRDDNCNYIHDPGEPDITALLKAGTYTTTACIIVPPDTGKISINTAIRWEGHSIAIGTDIDNNYDFELIAKTGDIVIDIHNKIDANGGHAKLSATKQVRADRDIFTQDGKTTREEFRPLHFTATGKYIVIGKKIDLSHDTGLINIVSTESDIVFLPTADIKDNSQVRVISARDIIMTGVKIESNGNNPANYHIVANNRIDALGAEIKCQKGCQITIKSGDRMVLSSGKIEAKESGGNINIEANGNAHIDDTQLKAANIIELDIKYATNTVFLDKAEVSDADNSMHIKPSGAIISGSLDKGGWHY